MTHPQSCPLQFLLLPSGNLLEFAIEIGAEKSLIYHDLPIFVVIYGDIQDFLYVYHKSP